MSAAAAALNRRSTAIEIMDSGVNAGAASEGQSADNLLADYYLDGVFPIASGSDLLTLNQ